MKKQIIKLAAILLLISIGLSAVSCDITPVGKNDLDTNNQTDNKETTDMSEVDISQELLTVEPYQLIAEREIRQVGTALTDGEFNYFYFKLGETKNVPVYYNAAYYHNGTTSSVYKWEKAYITEDTYKSAVENSISNSASLTSKLTLSSEFSASVKASYNAVSADMGLKISTQLTDSLAITSTETQKTSFTNSISKLSEESQSRSVTIPIDAPIGFYRYVVYGNFDIYAALICDLQNNEISYTYISIPKVESFFDAFRYSTENDFIVPDTTEKLALTEDAVATLSDDLFAKDIPNKTIDYIYAKTSLYTNSEQRKITHVGYYGLAQTTKGDALNLRELKDYMTKDYVFWFDIKVNAECAKNFLGSYIKGYHEMHLYRRWNDPIDIEIDEDRAFRDYGWLGEKVWTTEKGYDDFDWYINGQNCEEIMYIFYDAHGEDEDTWYLKYIEVEVKVLSADALNNH